MSIADALAQTYFDHCDIYRYEDIVTQGITRQKECLKYSGVKCALSQDSLSKVSGNKVSEISASAKVFFSPDADIKEGDKLVITQQGSAVSHKYKAGEIFIYNGSHIEVKVSRSDKA